MQITDYRRLRKHFKNPVHKRESGLLCVLNTNDNNHLVEINAVGEFKADLIVNEDKTVTLSKEELNNYLKDSDVCTTFFYEYYPQLKVTSEMCYVATYCEYRNGRYVQVESFNCGPHITPRELIEYAENILLKYEPEDEE